MKTTVKVSRFTLLFPSLEKLMRAVVPAGANRTLRLVRRPSGRFLVMTAEGELSFDDGVRFSGLGDCRHTIRIIIDTRTLMKGIICWRGWRERTGGWGAGTRFDVEVTL